MMDEDYFYSIERQRTTTIKIKHSVFVCTLEYVESIAKAKEFISRISKENKTATHNCWAYILGEKGEVFHSSDAGGKPSVGVPVPGEIKFSGRILEWHLKMGVTISQALFFSSFMEVVCCRKRG